MEFCDALAAELATHPAAKAVDIIKFSFQSVFGGAHILTNPAKAKAALADELSAVAAVDSPLAAPLGGDLYRISLAAWRHLDLPAEWLLAAVTASAERTRGDRALFLARLAEAEGILADAAPDTAKEFKKIADAYLADGIRPVSHSEGYRAAYRPAYRILDGRSLRLVPILCAIRARLGKRPLVVRIDGRAASGKSSMASELSAILGCGTVHMDDFFLPPALRTEERLGRAGGNVHTERFAEEVLPHLAREADFTYRRFDCSQMALGEDRRVAGGELYLVEGSYSAHPDLGSYADLTVFSDVSPKEQMARIEARNGPRLAERFRTAWIPMEETYFSTFAIREHADLTV